MLINIFFITHKNCQKWVDAQQLIFRIPVRKEKDRLDFLKMPLDEMYGFKIFAVTNGSLKTRLSSEK